MTLKEIDAFKAFAPLLVPAVFDINFLKSIDDYDDYAVITFDLAKPMQIDLLVDNLDDQMEFNILYQVRVKNANEVFQQCCAYSNPSFGDRFKINAQTDDKEMVSIVVVYLYSSLEMMLEALKEDLEKHSGIGEAYA